VAGTLLRPKRLKLPPLFQRLYEKDVQIDFSSSNLEQFEGDKTQQTTTNQVGNRKV